jgi:acetyl-CoA C-acetyltransferase
MEEFALASHTRALAAIAEGRFKNEIVPVALPDGQSFAVDECPRDTSLEKMAGLKPLAEGGRITAAVASQICDASSAMLIASEQAVETHGLTPRARVHHLSVRGDDPIWMLTGPIRATWHALEKTGLSVEDIDLFECNEAFASVVLAWSRELDVPLDKVNVNGGGIALGHPIGATGTRLMTTLLNELERTGARFGLQTMCEGGGQANVTIIERLG